MLAAVLFINYVDRGTLPTAAHLMQGDLHFDDVQMGTLLSAFSWTYAFLQVPVGWLAERYGAHRILAAGLTLWASATMLIGTAHTFAMLLVLRLLLGVGESAGFPCVAKLLAEVVPPKGLGTANGIVGFAYLFGPAVGTYVGGRLMAEFGWRSAFLVFGALSLLWLWPWSRTAMPESARVGGGRAARTARLADAVSGARAASVPIAASTASTAGSGRSAGEDSPTFWMILKHPALWGTALGLFSSNYTFFFMLSWLPSYLERERGFSTVEMAQLVGVAYLVNAVCALLGGWGIDRFIARGGSVNVGYKGVMVIVHVGSVMCMLCMALGSKPIAIGFMFLYQALCGASSPGVYAVCQILAGPRAAGRWVGIQNSLGNLAGIVAPLVTGFVVQSTGHFTNAFLVAAVMSMLGLIGWVWMLPKLEQLTWRRGAAAVAASA
jgi:MFS family permease